MMKRRSMRKRGIGRVISEEGEIRKKSLEADEEKKVLVEEKVESVN